MRYKGMTVALITILMSAPASSADTQPANTGKATAKEKVYCIKETTSGTRMAKKVCRTKAEWAVEGIEVGDKARTD